MRWRIRRIVNGCAAQQLLAAIRADLAAAPATAAEAGGMAPPTPPEALIRADRGR
jgi:hypothetical protein